MWTRRDRLRLDDLPLEIRVMVFENLVEEQPTLGAACLVSYRWRAAVQYSYAYRLYTSLGEDYLRVLARPGARGAAFFSFHMNMVQSSSGLIDRRAKELFFRMFGARACVNTEHRWMMLWTLCKADQHRSARLLVTVYKMAHCSYAHNIDAIFQDTCRRCHVETARSILQTFQIHPDRIEDALYSASARNKTLKTPKMIIEILECLMGYVSSEAADRFNKSFSKLHCLE